MAITQKYLGGAGSTTSLSSWSSAFGSGPGEGDVCIVAIVTDNIETSGGQTNTHTGLSGHSQTWTKLGEQTTTSGVAGDGVTISLWISSPSPIVAETLSFTATFSSAVVAKVATGEIFTGENLTVDTIQSASMKNSSSYGSMSESGLPTRARVWYRISGGEYGASTNATPTSGWAVQTGVQAGSGASGVMVRHEFKFSTSAGETSSFTQNIAVDSASFLVSVYEDTGGGASITLSPDPASVTNGGTTQITITRSTAASGNVTYDLSSTDTGVATVPATATILDGQTTGTFDITGVALGSATITATNANDENETESVGVLVTAVRKLRVLVEAIAAGVTGVSGVVFQEPEEGSITGAKIGEFSGASFGAELVGGKAELKVDVSEFGGEALTTNDVPAVLMRTDDYTTGITQVDVSIIEE